MARRSRKIVRAERLSWNDLSPFAQRAIMDIVEFREIDSIWRGAGPRARAPIIIDLKNGKVLKMNKKGIFIFLVDGWKKIKSISG
ncbi:MAG: hypothetical protein Q6363_007875 [Candidatus Njordarchaeota archaeon]